MRLPTPTSTLSFSNGPLPHNNPPLFVIPSVAEGSAVLRTLPGNVFDIALLP
jgi:hypothetical protein